MTLEALEAALDACDFEHISVRRFRHCVQVEAHRGAVKAVAEGKTEIEALCRLVEKKGD